MELEAPERQFYGGLSPHWATPIERRAFLSRCNRGAPSVAIRVSAKGKSESELADFPGLRDMPNAEGVRDLLVVNGFPNFNFFSTNNLLAW
jgi:hypothetical protein